MVEKKRIRTLYVDVNANRDNFVYRMIGPQRPHDFSDIKLLRTLLSNEKVRILYVLKSQNPKSIYALAKLVGRDFKSVRQDVLVLKRFGFVEFIAEKTGKRKCLMPVLKIDQLQIEINV